MHITVTNPYDLSTVAELPTESSASLSSKIAHAENAFRQWSNTSIEHRVQAVRRCLSYFTAHKTRIAQEITQQMGKPITEALNEVDGFLTRAEYLCDIAATSLAADVLPHKAGFHRRIEHVPLGIVLNIAAWNYPLMIAVNVVVPALLSGNSVLLKHSAKTPLCGQHFEQAFAALPIPNLVTHLIIDHEQTQQLVQDTRIQYIAFTGSVQGGRALYQAVGQHRFIDVGLELGGNDPAYIAADADLDMTIPNIVEGACYNAGQSCCAIERVYIHRSIYDACIARLQTQVATPVMGNPMAPNTTLGPLVSMSGVNRITQQVQQAVEDGAALLSGGKPAPQSEGLFYHPTLLVDVPQSSRVMQEETFGPVIPVQCVDSDEQAVKRMNDTRFGLTASLWTTDQNRAEALSRHIHAGTIFQNRCDFLDPALPWSGVGDSGKGSTLSTYGFWHLTQRKSLHFRL